MSSKAELSSRALVKIGRFNERIVDLDTDTSFEADVCNLLYDKVLRRLVLTGYFSSTKFIKDLNKTTTTPLNGYASEFQLPTEPKFLKLIRLYTDCDFEILGDKIYTNTDSLRIKYLGEPESVNSYGIELEECFVNDLAFELSLAFRLPVTVQQVLDASRKESLRMASLVSLDNVSGLSYLD